MLQWASTYAAGGFTIADTNQPANAGAAAAGAGGQSCTENSQLASFVAPNVIVSEAVNYAEEQLGKPYLFGGTGPDAFDCSGLVMMAYRAAGVNIARTSEQQWPRCRTCPRTRCYPATWCSSPGPTARATAPGHVGLVISKNTDDRGVRDRHPGPGLHVRHGAVPARRRDGCRLCPALAKQRQ